MYNTERNSPLGESVSLPIRLFLLFFSLSLPKTRITGHPDSVPPVRHIEEKHGAMNGKVFNALTDALGQDPTNLERRFVAFDRKREGIVAPAFFMSAMREAGVNLTTFQLEQLMKSYVKEGVINYKEFIDDFLSLVKKEKKEQRKVQKEINDLEAAPAVGLPTHKEEPFSFGEGEKFPETVLYPLSDAAKNFIASLKKMVRTLSVGDRDGVLMVWEKMLVGPTETIDAEQFINRGRRVVHADSLNVDAESIRECYRHYSPGHSARAGLDLASFRRMCE